MNLLDFLILTILVADIMRGADIGFARQFFNVAGLGGGLLLAALVAPMAASQGHTELSKFIIVAGVLVAVASAVTSLSEAVGGWLANVFERFRISGLDKALGAVFGGLVVVLAVWIVSAVVLNLPSLQLSQAVQRSKIVRLVDSLLPPAPPLISKLQHVIDPNGFPQVFLGPEPAPGSADGGATDAEISQATAADQASVVKLEGIGCGGEVFGSGFVAASGVVVTNAHVVAGISRTVVEDQAGLHAARVVYFDPNADLAVLRVTGLADPPLAINYAAVPPRTAAVVLGYPGGGPLAAAGASVIQSYIATGRNIYDSAPTARQIYEFQADVQPGNSGGPLVTPDGTVIGVVFARSESNDSIGYALTTREAKPAIAAGASSTAPVSTGSCTD